MVCNYVSSFTWCHVQNKRSTTTTQNNVYNIYIAVRERKYKSLYFIHVEIENMSRFEYTYVLTNVHVFSRYFIDVITIINTQLKNTSINYLLFDFNTRRIILISLSDPNTNSKLLIPCFNAFIDIVIPGMFSAKPLQILKRVCQYNFKHKRSQEER